MECTNHCLEWEQHQQLFELIDISDFMFCPFCGCELERSE